MTRKTSPAYRASKEETIPIDKLHPFSNHPFHIRRDLEFSELVNSISESGIITPIIVRPKVGVGYKSYMTYNKSHVDDFLSHNRINHSEENFVLVKGDFEPIVSEKLWETCNQIRSKRAAFVKGKDGRAHKFGVSFPQNKWTKTLFCDCGDAIPNRRLSSMAKEAWANRVIILRLWTWLRTLID